MANFFINGIDLTEPGKRILLIAQAELSNEEAFQVKQILEEEFTGIKFSVLTGIDQAIVLPDTPSYDFEGELNE